MQSEPNNNAEKANEPSDNKSVPFEGFINVNEIVRLRRQLKTARFNNPDQIWDAQMNQIKPQQSPDKSDDKT